MVGFLEQYILGALLLFRVVGSSKDPADFIMTKFSPEKKRQNYFPRYDTHPKKYPPAFARKNVFDNDNIPLPQGEIRPFPEPPANHSCPRTTKFCTNTTQANSHAAYENEFSEQAKKRGLCLAASIKLPEKFSAPPSPPLHYRPHRLLVNDSVRIRRCALSLRRQNEGCNFWA